jgi:hypothetical protein
MSNNDLVTDAFMYHGPGACRNCFTPLILVDSEQTVMDLDPEGNVVDIVESHYICRAMCPKCNEKYEMMRFLGKYYPYSETAFKFKAEAHREEVDRRNKNMRIVKDNPFL